MCRGYLRDQDLLPRPISQNKPLDDFQAKSYEEIPVKFLGDSEQTLTVTPRRFPGVWILSKTVLDDSLIIGGDVESNFGPGCVRFPKFFTKIFTK